MIELNCTISNQEKEEFGKLAQFEDTDTDEDESEYSEEHILMSQINQFDGVPFDLTRAST